MKKPDLRGKVPESWACIDCGVNTAPGHLNREQMEQALALDWNNGSGTDLGSCGHGADGRLSVCRLS
jgi:hypothetical protein